MEPYIKKYFSQVSEEQAGKNYFRVIVLDQDEKLSFDELKEMVPLLPRGWFELSRLSKADRIEFVRDFWISKLPYHPDSTPKLMQFFAGIEDIGIVVAERHFSESFEVHMIYALSEGRGFFHGAIPITDEESLSLQKLFPDLILPQDYLAFLQIHSGFSKSTDSGIIPPCRLKECLERFSKLVTRDSPLLTTKGKAVNPHSLIPFYESFGMPFYQCFWQDWYPENEMGNVYYSGSENSISDPVDRSVAIDEMAFPTFLDWLFFYLERLI